MEIRIASLLHDIGKFYQRTQISLDQSDKCLRYMKNGSYKHAAYTAMFFDRYLSPYLKNYLDIMNKSAGHHSDNFSVVKIADCVAAGHDRPKPGDKEEYEKKEKEDENRYQYITRRLGSIFTDVDYDLNKNEKYNAQLTSLSNFEYIPEKDYHLSKEEASREYKKLFEEFCKELDEIESKTITDINILHERIYPLVKEYTTTIPANTFTEDFTTVSLFDHMKLTTAIATCLEQMNPGEDFIIVDYDLSGIQKFIFDITEGTSTKAGIAKHLRTRSFFLSILADFLSFYILKEFNLSYENILYSSGGRGRIILPYRKDIDKVLHDINYQFEKLFIDEFSGKLSCTLYYHTVSQNELSSINLSDLFSYATKKDISTKDNKFADYLSRNDKFENPPITKCCKMCECNSAENSELCDFCKELEKVNDFITRNKNFIIKFSFNPVESKDDLLKLGNLGSINLLSQVADFEIDEHSYFVSINCHKIGESKYYALHDNNDLSFDKLANYSEGDKKIAVLKMDVDNLGYIFLKGIRKNKQTLSKSLTLSRMMEYFFTRKIKQIVNFPKYDNKIYINYSGGDDLLLVTPASLSLDLVKDINNQFNSFSCLNKSIHISAGIEIFNHKTPIRFAVLRGEDNLEEAKKAPGKASFSVLDCVINNNLIENTLQEIEYFKKALSEQTVSRTNIYKVYEAILNSLNMAASEVEFYRYIPQIAYSLKRNISNKELFEKMKAIFITPNIDKNILYQYKVVLGYTLMETR